ncbi:hypothetical protein AAF712_016644 [Marasmius tenuissimus]|uniref:DUF6535 domain-containing protein n=1 Tax=Marasmius tenuissimus TaxID=585030 RepID=A0ABR2Z5B2_9AGAR
MSSNEPTVNQSLGSLEEQTWSNQVGFERLISTFCRFVVIYRSFRPRQMGSNFRHITQSTAAGPSEKSRRRVKRAIRFQADSKQTLCVPPNAPFIQIKCHDNPTQTPSEPEEDTSPSFMHRSEQPDRYSDPTRATSTVLKPPLEKSWEVVTKEINSLDEGFIGGWKEDIDTLLVFAGLFSAVVTAFTVESYQWLDEAPEDATIALLAQIFQQMTGETVSRPPQFKVSTSIVCINVLWFFSLIIALIDALFALLCKQWLREHRRHTHTRTPEEALALRWLRNQSLERWHVPTILASLPILLELALFLFLVGLLELLRVRHPVPFMIAVIVVGFAGAFYLGTTILPAVDIIRQALQITPDLARTRVSGAAIKHSPVDFIANLPPMEYTCPYKSPQAWATFKVLRTISRLPPFPRLFSLFRKGGNSTILWSPTRAYEETIDPLTSWSLVDLEALQRSNIHLAPNFYELNAFRWVVTELRDTPIMVPHLQNILESFPSYLVMPAVFDQWLFHPGREWYIGDIGNALRSGRSSPGIKDYRSSFQRMFVEDRPNPELFNDVLHWTHVLINVGKLDSTHHQKLADLMHELNDRMVQAGYATVGFPVAFHRMDSLLESPKTRDLGSDLWRLCGDAGRIGLSRRDQRKSSTYFMHNLAAYIITSSPNYILHMPTTTTTSPFVQSQPGAKSLYDIHQAALGLGMVFPRWMHTMDIVRRVHQLPEDHFKTPPGLFPLPLQQLEKELSYKSRGGTEIDFGYLTILGDYWDNANTHNKRRLLSILSNHINEFHSQSTAESHANLDDGSEHSSPLVRSAVGLELITFINDRLVDEKEAYNLFGYDIMLAWRETIDHIKSARRDLPPGHFKPILHDGTHRPDQSPAPVIVSQGDAAGSASKEMAPPAAGTFYRSSLVEGENDAVGEGETLMENPAVVYPAGSQRANEWIAMKVGGLNADMNV